MFLFSTQDLTNYLSNEKQEENDQFEIDVNINNDLTSQYCSTLPKNFRRGVQKKV